MGPDWWLIPHRTRGSAAPVYSCTSTIFCTQYRKEDWHTRLGGGVHADAIMDRIVHNAIWIETGRFSRKLANVFKSSPPKQGTQHLMEKTPRKHNRTMGNIPIAPFFKLLPSYNERFKTSGKNRMSVHRAKIEHFTRECWLKP